MRVYLAARVSGATAGPTCATRSTPTGAGAACDSCCLTGACHQAHVHSAPARGRRRDETACKPGARMCKCVSRETAACAPQDQCVRLIEKWSRVCDRRTLKLQPVPQDWCEAHASTGTVTRRVVRGSAGRATSCRAAGRVAVTVDAPAAKKAWAKKASFSLSFSRKGQVNAC